MNLENVPEVSTTSGSKVMTQSVFLYVFGDLDRGAIYYFLTHKVRMKY